MSQPRVPSLAAVTVQGNADYMAKWFGMHGATAVTMPADDPLRVHALLGAMVRSPDAHRFGIETGVQGSMYNDGIFPATYAGFVSARLHGRTRHAFGWVGAGAGALDDQLHRYPLAMADLGVSTRWRRLRITAGATHHRTESEPRVELPEGRDTAVTLRDPIVYTDLLVEPRTDWGPLELAARAGVRVVHRTIAFEPRERRAFGSLDAAWWATPRVAVVATWGQQLADLARGLPTARYVTLSVRARLQGPERSTPGAATPRRIVTGSAPDILMEGGSVSGASMRVLAAVGVRSVEVAGTFSEWEPIRLEPDGAGAWRMPARVPSGAHRVLVRVDGGTWLAPANLPTLLDDDLGAHVGLVTVP